MFARVRLVSRLNGPVALGARTAILVLVSTLSCSPDAGDPEPFVGDWVYVEGFMEGTCEGVAASEPLAKREVALSRRGEDRLEFSGGPACKFELVVEGDSASTRSGTCETTVSEAIAIGRFQSFSLQLSDGLLRHSAAGTAVIQTATATLDCTQFEYVDAILERR